jgi:hypothetical protein
VARLPAQAAKGHYRPIWARWRMSALAPKRRPFVPPHSMSRRAKNERSALPRANTDIKLAFPYATSAVIGLEAADHSVVLGAMPACRL